MPSPNQVGVLFFFAVKNWAQKNSNYVSRKIEQIWDVYVHIFTYLYISFIYKHPKLIDIYVLALQLEKYLSPPNNRAVPQSQTYPKAA